MTTENTQPTPEVAEEKGQRENLLVTLSETTLASIPKAAEHFEKFGLTEKRARAMVREEVERLSKDVDAVELFKAQIAAELEKV